MTEISCKLGEVRASCFLKIFVILTIFIVIAVAAICHRDQLIWSQVCFSFINEIFFNDLEKSELFWIFNKLSVFVTHMHSIALFNSCSFSFPTLFVSKLFRNIFYSISEIVQLTTLNENTKSSIDFKSTSVLTKQTAINQVSDHQPINAVSG